MLAVLGNLKTLITGKKIQLGITEQVAGTSPKSSVRCIYDGQLSPQEAVEFLVVNGSEKCC